MPWLLSIFSTRIGRTAIMVFGGIGFALAVILGAQRSAVKRDRAERERDQLRDALNTRERIDDALATSHAGGGSWHDRLQRTEI